MSDPKSPTTLVEILAAEIRERGPISFARFMERALYEPGLGYYAVSAGRAGRDGDYFTAAQVGTAFAQCLARELVELHRCLGRPDPFAIFEFGAGNGWLARNLLDALRRTDPDLVARARITLVDAGQGMREAAAARVPEATVVAPGSASPAPAGVVLGLELFDALPVHRLRRAHGVLREIFVDLDAGGRFVECLREPLPAAAALAARYEAAPEEGDEAEVCPAALEELSGMAGCLERGFLLFVDYGDAAPRLYGRERRRGTLLAYHAHRTSEAYLERVGEQDLTAHVNFTALEDHARELGLEVLGRTTQDRFLIANGILACFEENDPERLSDPAFLRTRLAAQQLLHVEGMGRIFQVLVLAKGLAPAPRLRGLEDPFAASSPFALDERE